MANEKKNQNLNEITSPDDLLLSEAEEMLPADEETEAIVAADEPIPEKPSKNKSGGENGYLVRLVLVLTCICTGIAFLLALVNMLTEDVIAENNARARQDAILAVFPEGDRVEPYVTASGETVYMVLAGSEIIGYTVNTSPSGYVGPVEMMVGMTPDGAVSGIKIVSTGETPGVGTKIASPTFLEQFFGKSAPVALGEDVDAISGATFSSRAVEAAVNTAVTLEVDIRDAAAKLQATVNAADDPEDNRDANEDNGDGVIDIGDAVVEGEETTTPAAPETEPAPAVTESMPAETTASPTTDAPVAPPTETSAPETEIPVVVEPYIPPTPETDPPIPVVVEPYIPPVTEAPYIPPTPETEPPVITEAPVETTAPIVTEAPVETEGPIETTVSVETTVPVETEAPIETEPPMIETEAPETEPPTEVIVDIVFETEPPVVETEAPVTESPATEPDKTPAETKAPGNKGGFVFS